MNPSNQSTSKITRIVHNIVVPSFVTNYLIASKLLNYLTLSNDYATLPSRPEEVSDNAPKLSVSNANRFHYELNLKFVL